MCLTYIPPDSGPLSLPGISAPLQWCLMTDLFLVTDHCSGERAGAAARLVTDPGLGLAPGERITHGCRLQSGRGNSLGKLENGQQCVFLCLNLLQQQANENDKTFRLVTLMHVVTCHSYF